MQCASADSIDPRGVLVGLSGGVDSAVAALVLADRGYRVTGVTLALWSDPMVTREAHGPQETVAQGRSVAAELGIPHVTVDAAEAFCSKVVEYFVAEYGRGRTPNPCVKCNSRFRFRLMVEVARSLGLRYVATGHYARVVGDPPSLARGIDRDKDQSYVLAEVAPELLGEVVFPLGSLTKDEVRAIAASAGLQSAEARESQEICFVPDNDHKKFLTSRLGKRPGSIVDVSDRVLGRHEGTYNYTIGQRRGLGLAGEQPAYVISVRPDRGQVVVGSAADAAVGVVTICDVVRHRSLGGGAVTVQLRSAGGSIPAHMSGETTIVLHEPATGVAPGQTAVVYEEDNVVIAGTIESTARWGEEAEKAP